MSRKFSNLVFWFLCFVSAAYGAQNNTYHPVNFYINGAFDVTQNPHYFNQHDYFEKHKTVWRRVRSPLSSIENNGGYKKFFNNEFFSNRVAPNIALHTLGSGYDFLKLRDYLAQDGISNPGLWAGLLTYMVHFGNEALEATSDKLDAKDHIADLYFFDVLAFPLFMNEKSARFFIEDLGMTQWHFQPVYLPKEEEFNNAGLNYVFRPPALGEHVRPFIMFGMQIITGLSFYQPNGDIYSLGTGTYYTDPLAGKTQWSWGVFYETQQQLAASFLINSTSDYDFRLNLYPSLLKYKDHRIGLFIAEDEDQIDVVKKTRE
jgi:hypothetical protein